MSLNITAIKKLPLPLELAIVVAAVQNFDRDVELRLESWRHWPSEKSLYLEEARFVLESTGENYIPDFHHHDHIVVDNNVKFSEEYSVSAYLDYADTWWANERKRSMHPPGFKEFEAMLKERMMSCSA